MNHLKMWQKFKYFGKAEAFEINIHNEIKNLFK